MSHHADSVRDAMALAWTGTPYGIGNEISVDAVIEAITDWAARHPDVALPWEDFADESTLTRPLYVHKAAQIDGSE